MNIAISLNQKYFYYTYVMLTSLFENEREECIDVYLTHSGLDEASIEAFDKLATKYGNNIHSMHIDRNFFPDSLPTSDAWSIEMYFRLALIDLLPQHVDRILYLDVDTIVTNSLTGIYNEDFEDKCFVVCEDTSTLSMVGQKRYELFKELLDEGYRYFNSGVMLWNIKKLRGKFDLSKYISMFIELSDYISSPDQDLLNYVHHDDVKYSEADRYNLFAIDAQERGMTCEYIKDNVSLVHFAGPKPWKSNYVHYPVEGIWWEYAKMTPYYSYLLEDFMEKTIADSKMYSYVKSLKRENLELQSKLDESISINRRLVEMVQGKV